MHFTYKYQPYSHRKPQDITITAAIQRFEIILPPCEFFGNYSCEETGPPLAVQTGLDGRAVRVVDYGMGDP
jgi:hypothetical protein